MIPSISPMPARWPGHLLRQRPRVQSPRGEEVGGHLDPAQRVADLVGDARRHLAQRRQLLLLDEPALGLHLLGEVAEHPHRAHELPARVEDAADGEVRGKGLPRAAVRARHLPAPSRPAFHRPRDGGSGAAAIVRAEQIGVSESGEPALADARAAAGRPGSWSPAARRTSAVKMQSSTLWTTEASRRSPRRTSSSLTLSDSCIWWKEATSCSASSLEMVKRSSTIMRAAAAPRGAASRRSKRMRSSSSSGTARSAGDLPPNSSRVIARASSSPTKWWTSRSISVGDRMAGAPAPPLSSARAPTKAAAWARSSARCSLRRETRTKSPVLRKSDQNTPWLSGSSPSRPEKGGGPEDPEAEGAVDEEGGRQHPFLAQRRDDEGVEPHEESRRDPREGALAVAAAPVQAEKDRGRALAHRHERQQPHLHEEELAPVQPRPHQAQRHYPQHGQARVEQVIQ